MVCVCSWLAIWKYFVSLHIDVFSYYWVCLQLALCSFCFHIACRALKGTGYWSRWRYDFCRCSCWKSLDRRSKAFRERYGFFLLWSIWNYMILMVGLFVLLIPSILINSLCPSGVHPTIIAHSFQKAAHKAVEILRDMSVPVNLDDRDTLLKSAHTSLNSKVCTGGKSGLAFVHELFIY